MPNVHDNRQAHLVQLVSEINNPKTGRGGKLFVAKTAGISHVSVSNIIARAPKSERPGEFHMMGPEMARKIETAFMLPEGSFDLPVAISEVPSLSEKHQALLDAIETRMRAGVLTEEECEAELVKIESLYPMNMAQAHQQVEVPSGHVFIFGSTGAGKTNLKDLIAYQLKHGGDSVQIVIQ